MLSGVVAAELLVGAQHVDRERTLPASADRAIPDPIERLVTPSWSTWELVARLDQTLRKRPANRPRLAQRSFLHDMLIAATAREIGATVITENSTDFTLIARHLDIAFVQPFPPSPAV